MRGFIFDMNGTMIDDMHYHAAAWHKIIVQLGSTMTPAESKWHIYGKAEEMFERIFGENHPFSKADIQRIAKEKEVQYQKDFLPHLQLLPGLENFLSKAHRQGIPMAIGTAAPRSNVDYVFKHLDVEKYFPITVSAEEVVHAKPNPEVFLKCAQYMQVPSQDCIVFEDSPKGIEAAANAGMKAIAITSFHPAEDFYHFENILFIIDNYNDEQLISLF